MASYIFAPSMIWISRASLLVSMLCRLLHAQDSGAAATSSPGIPEWALPGSPTHKQVPPPADFHRPTKTVNEPLGVFQGESDIGGPFVPGSSSYDAGTKQYTINSAGYNIWYTRDEFRYLSMANSQIMRQLESDRVLDNVFATGWI